MKQSSLLAFAGGILVGAAASLLLTSDKGVYARKKIRVKAARKYEAMKEHFENSRCHCPKGHKEAMVNESQKVQATE